MASKRTAYHHGDLHNALLDAGEAVLAETGIRGFSLRAVARQVGVSHAAPAHHFGDAAGLLEALGTEGFTRFLAAMEARTRGIDDDPRERLLASALGYLDFAIASPALFRLMFGPDRACAKTQAFKDAAEASFEHLVAGVTALRGRSPYDDAAAMADVVAIWSLVHGYAELLISGHLPPTYTEEPMQFRRVFMRTLD